MLSVKVVNMYVQIEGIGEGGIPKAGKNSQIRVQSRGAKAELSVTAKAADAPQSPGKLVTQEVVTSRMVLASRAQDFVAPFVEPGPLSQGRKLNTVPEAGERRPLTIPEWPKGRRKNLQEGARQRALKSNEPLIGAPGPFTGDYARIGTLLGGGSAPL